MRETTICMRKKRKTRVLGKKSTNVTFRCKSKRETKPHITHTHNEGKRLENFFVLFSEICDIYNYNSSSCRRRPV